MDARGERNRRVEKFAEDKGYKIYPNYPDFDSTFDVMIKCMCAMMDEIEELKGVIDETN